MQEVCPMVRRKFSAQFKQQVVKECLETGVIAAVARKHDLGANVVNRWVREYKNNGTVAASKSKAAATHVTADEYKQLLVEKAELETKAEQLAKTLGEQTLEVAILRDLLKKKNPHLLTKLK
jgi:transposase